MIFSYNWLQSFFNKKLPAPEKLADVLTMHSFEVKGVKPIVLPSAAKDIVLDIDILPNRTHDCYSHLGVAKEISVLFNIPLKTAEQKPDVLKQRAEDFLSLEVKEPVLCRRYIAGVMIDIKVGPSPEWLKERLFAIGQKSINNIVDCANYAMFEIGQPLHAFDFDKIESRKLKVESRKKEIIVRKAKKGEKITTLDNRNYELDENILVIADSKEPLAIAGIKGGKCAEIDKNTKNIIIESANFEPTNIRLTSKKIGLATGASVGFENEISPFLAEVAIERVMALVQETGGGKIISGKIDFYPVKFRPPKIVFKPADIPKFLGVPIAEKEIISILNKLNIKTKKTKGAIIAVGPGERLDLSVKEDLIEEIARIRGYEKIPSKTPEGILAPPLRNDSHVYGAIVRNLLVGAGFSEVYNYSFASTGEILIENPVSEEKKFLRQNLLDGLKDNAEKNLKNFDEVKIFEIGKIFNKFKDSIEEKSSLAGVIACKKPKKKSVEFYEIKGTLEMLFSRLGIGDFWFDDSSADKRAASDSPIFLAEIKIGKEGIGFIDRNAFELDLEKLIKLAVEEVEYRPVSKYPAATRDIAILVPIKTKVIEALDVIENTAGPLLIDTDLFDIYEGEELGEERKSLAFRLTFQSKEKTLTDKEVNALMEKIIKAVESVEDWEVRR